MEIFFKKFYVFTADDMISNEQQDIPSSSTKLVTTTSRHVTAKKAVINVHGKV